MRDASTINHWNPFENYISKIHSNFPGNNELNLSKFRCRSLSCSIGPLPLLRSFWMPSVRLITDKCHWPNELQPGHPCIYKPPQLFNTSFKCIQFINTRKGSLRYIVMLSMLSQSHSHAYYFTHAHTHMYTHKCAFGSKPRETKTNTWLFYPQCSVL